VPSGVDSASDSTLVKKNLPSSSKLSSNFNFMKKKIIGRLMSQKRYRKEH